MGMPKSGLFLGIHWLSDRELELLWMIKQYCLHYCCRNVCELVFLWGKYNILKNIWNHTCKKLIQNFTYMITKMVCIIIISLCCCDQSFMASYIFQGARLKPTVLWLQSALAGWVGKARLRWARNCSLCGAPKYERQASADHSFHQLPVQGWVDLCSILTRLSLFLPQFILILIFVIFWYIIRDLISYEGGVWYIVAREIQNSIHTSCQHNCDQCTQSYMKSVFRSSAITKQHDYSIKTNRISLRTFHFSKLH